MKRRTSRILQLIIISTIGLIFYNCGNTEIETENTVLKNQIVQLKKQINELEIENKKLKETDQYYFNCGIDYYNKAQNNQSKEILKESAEYFYQLINKFPESVYLSKARFYINTINAEIEKIDIIENGRYNINEALNNHDFQRAYRELRKLSGLITQDDYNEINTLIYSEKNKPIEIQLADLHGEGVKYREKRVKLGPLRVNSVELQDKNLRCYEAFSDNTWGKICVLIKYDQTENPTTWRRLDTNKGPIIYAIGIYKEHKYDFYKGAYGFGYIQAQQIVLDHYVQ